MEDGTEKYYVLTKEGLRQVTAEIVKISPDQNHVVYRNGSVWYLGRPGMEELRTLHAAGLDVAWRGESGEMRDLGIVGGRTFSTTISLTPGAERHNRVC